MQKRWILTLLLTIALILPLTNSNIASGPHSTDFAPCFFESSISAMSSLQPGVVKVTVLSVRAISDFDPDVVPFFSDEQDFYGKVSIDGESFKLPYISERDTADYRNSPVSKTIIGKDVITINIDIWDADVVADDHADLNPMHGKYDLDFNVDLCRLQISGDVSGRSGNPITIRGDGDGTSGWHHTTEITFVVDTIPVSSDDLAIIGVNMVQVVPHSPVLVAKKPTILNVTAINNFPDKNITTSIRVTIIEPARMVNYNFSNITLKAASVKSFLLLIDTPYVPPAAGPDSHTVGNSYHISVRTEIDPERIYRPESGCKAANDIATNIQWKVMNTRTLDILFGKVGSARDWLIGNFATNAELQASTYFSRAFMLATYPIASVHTDVIFGPILLPVSGTIDIASLASVVGMPVAAIEPVIMVWELSQLAPTLGYDKIVGVGKEDFFNEIEPVFHSWAGAEGLSLIEMAPHGVISIANRMNVPVHELGHTFGLSVDPRLKSIWSSETFPVTRFAWDEYVKDPPEGNPANGFWLTQGREPSELSDLMNKPVCNAHCFMGYFPIQTNMNWTAWKESYNFNMPAWIDGADYEHLIQKLGLARDPETIVLSGIITSQNKVFLGEWYRLREGGIPDLVSNSSGTHSFVFLDKAGHSLSQIRFTPQTRIADYPDEFPFAPFSFVVNFPNGTSKIQLWNLLENTLLGERTVSSNVPIVRLSVPQSNQLVHRGQNLSIVWEGSDKDGDDLKYTLAMSKDGQKWFPVAFSLNVTKHVLNTTDIPEGKYLLKIISTDGVNVGHSPPVRIVIESRL